MNYSQIRREARSSLSGKWGKAALLTLVYTIIYSLISFGLSAISGLIPFLSYSLPLEYTQLLFLLFLDLLSL